ncbi:MAG: type III pantothenate kinase [Bacteroidales bacterium]|nr:type III pantothenate kinase [Bacteroidales bacterium]
MNLILDIGNTCCKICLFDDNMLINKYIVKSETSEILSELNNSIKKNIVERSIISSVAGNFSEVEEYLNRISGFNIVFGYGTDVPIKNSYSTPKTLGNDRLAAVVGASVIFPGRNSLVVDAGTAITYDFLKDGIEYIGGNIAPGISLRFKSLHEHTSKLPLIENYEWKEGFGDCTANAINNGVLQGVKFEIEGYISSLEKKYSDFAIILTGGDSIFLSKTIKNAIFAEPNLVTIGLNRILNYNVFKNF